MTRVGYIHIGDKGSDFIATFWETKQDPDNPDQLINTLLEVDGMEHAKMTWTKPDGTTITKDDTQGVALYTTGLDGKIHFLNDEAVNPGQTFPIDQGDDMWSIEAWIKLNDGSELYTDKDYFLVRGGKQ